MFIIKRKNIYNALELKSVYDLKISQQSSLTVYPVSNLSVTGVEEKVFFFFF